ncbi:hypothetical protein, partial [Actinophytocola sp.]|uniref:hypothetical protein n=1 Tax=Actinophytocola sp. TaxID=1872138 RepID=UPI0025BC2CCC
MTGMTGEQIYDNFYGGTGDDGRGLVTSVHQVNPLASVYEERAQQIIRLTERMEVCWQGEAAGAAQRGAGPLAVEHMTAAPKIDQVSGAMRDQVGAYMDAKATVGPVPPTPDKPGLWDNLTSLGGANASYEQQMNEVGAANDTNVTAMANYESVSDEARSRMPTFESNLEMDQASIGVKDSTPPPPVKPVKPPPPTKTTPPPTGTPPPGTSTPPSTGDPQYTPPTGPNGPGSNVPGPGQQNPPGITTPEQFVPTGPGGGPYGPNGPNGPYPPGGPYGPGNPNGPNGPYGPGGPYSTGPYGPGGGPGRPGGSGPGNFGRGFGPGGSGGPRGPGAG